MRKESAATAHVRQLCCLGIDSHVLMPALLDALHEIIPSLGNSFYWTDEDGDISDCFQEYVIPSVMDTFFSEGPRLMADPTFIRIGAAVSARHPTGNLNNPPGLAKTEFYDTILRPYRFHFALDGVLSLRDRPLGAVVLWRAANDRVFSHGEQQALVSLLPYFQHALTQSSKPQTAASLSGHLGLVVLSRDGQVLHVSQTARDLLYWAALDAPDCMGRMRDTPAQLSELCQRLNGAFEGRAVAPPQLTHRNRWGEFAFRAYYLEGTAEDQGCRIGVVVERREPIALRVSKNMRVLKLSPQQSEVGLRVGCGMTNEAIAWQLGVSVATVRDHLDKIYQKVGLSSREALIKQLAD
jgi:DNA-binding CsgD family transcriptional regulator